jgi:hypothetical protein
MPAILSTEEIARLGQERYDRDIRAKVEPLHRGEFLVVDVLTGEYEIAEDDLIASDRLLARIPQAILYGLCIGHPAAYRIGRLRIARVSEHQQQMH